MSALPATIAPFDPFSTALHQSSARLGKRDSNAMVEMSAALVSFYEGNQLWYFEEYLQVLVEDPTLRKRMAKLVDIQNITKLLVDRVTTLGRDPVSVVWSSASGAVSKEAQAIWDEIERSNDWMSFLSTVGHMTELCKTCTVFIGWSEKKKQIVLEYFTPNVLDVGYVRGNYDVASPDFYRILRSEGGGTNGADVWQVWDFSSEDLAEYSIADPQAPGGSRTIPASALVYEQQGEAWYGPARDAQPVPVLDIPGNPPSPTAHSPRSLVPFVAFRTARAKHFYYIDDGQEDLLLAQQTVNQYKSQKKYALWWMTAIMPVLKGGGWKGKDGRKDPVIIPDPSFAIVCPSPDPTSGVVPDIDWKGPASAEMIKTLAEAADGRVDDAATSFHISPQSIKVRGDAHSGYALFIESTGLREKQQRTKTLVQHPIEEIVRKARLTWDHFNPSRPFPKDARFSVSIPDLQFQQDPSTELQADVVKVNAGFVSLRSRIEKYNPGADPSVLDKLEQEARSASIAATRKSLFTSRAAAPDASNSPSGSAA